MMICPSSLTELIQGCSRGLGGVWGMDPGPQSREQCRHLFSFLQSHLCLVMLQTRALLSRLLYKEESDESLSELATL
jgi:hypothetical protein